MQLPCTNLLRGCAAVITFSCCSTAFAQLIPDRFFFLPYSTEGVPNSTLTVNGSSPPFGQTMITDPFVIEETDMMASGLPATEPGGVFERNSHLARFAIASELVPGNPNRFGHLFQRSEAWDIQYDLKIETDPTSPRKEAGFFFQSQSTGLDSMFIATSNAGHYTPGPGQITTVFQNVIPSYSFGATTGGLGDYNQNGAVDAADYVIWRSTLGSDTDFRANGDNTGASEDFIDEADYEVWKQNFGNTGSEGVEYNVGDTLTMRMIYMPPVVDETIPFDLNNPGANVITPGTMEYIISLNGGPQITSEPLDFENDWLGLPNDTYISARVQNLSTASAAPDESKVTFSNWDFNGEAAGSGLPGSGLGFGSVVPEPASMLLMLVTAGMLGLARRSRRS